MPRPWRESRERQVLGSYVSNWLGKLSTASDDLFDVDWANLLEIDEREDFDAGVGQAQADAAPPEADRDTRDASDESVADVIPVTSLIEAAESETIGSPTPSDAAVFPEGSHLELQQYVLVQEGLQSHCLASIEAAALFIDMKRLEEIPDNGELPGRLGALHELGQHDLRHIDLMVIKNAVKSRSGIGFRIAEILDPDGGVDEDSLSAHGGEGPPHSCRIRAFPSRP